MKRTHMYEVNHLNNTVVVNQKFLDNATQLNTNEAKLIKQFKQMGLTIIVQSRTSKKKAPRVLKGTSLPLLTYGMMKDYISSLDVADEMLKVFNRLWESNMKRSDRDQYVNRWFRATFPHYDSVPKFDANLRVIHTA